MTPRTAEAARPAATDVSAPRVLQRRLFGPTTVVFGAIAALFAGFDLIGLRMPEPVQAIPFALSVLLFGLPHGALDHLVPARLDPRISRTRSITVVVVGYALLGSATFGIWALLPEAGFALFIVVTWCHWGQGDLWLDRALLRTTDGRVDAALTVLVRGGMPMLIPLIAHPQEYAAVFHATTRLLGAHDEAVAVFESVPVRGAAAVLLGAALVVHLVVRHRLGAALSGVAPEIAVLSVFFLTVPPVLAVGLYFTFWHAVRHIVRLELLRPDGRRALERGRLLRPFARFLLDALPVTVCAVALLAGLALVLRDAGLGTYLVLIAALTTPHTAVVTWMDHRRHRSVRPTPPPPARATSRLPRIAHDGLRERARSGASIRPAHPRGSR